MPEGRIGLSGDSERWRGAISMLVESYGHRLEAMETRLQRLDRQVGELERNLSGFSEQLHQAQREIEAAAGELREERQREFDELKAALAAAVERSKDLKMDVMRFLIGPIVAGICVALVLLAITGKA